MRRHSREPRVPTPQELAAYADGELSAVDRRLVERWLASQPEALKDVQAPRRLSDLWRAAPPPEPTEAVWADTLAGIESGLSAAGPAAGKTPSVKVDRSWSWRRRSWAAVLATTAAAVAVVVVLLHRLPAESWPLVSPDDVEIISMDAADSHAIVVGQPPAQGPLLLAAAGEVALDSIEPDEDDMVPYVHMAPQGPNAPLIIAPLSTGIAKEP